MTQNNRSRIVKLFREKPQRTERWNEGNKSLVIIEIKGVIEVSVFSIKPFQSFNPWFRVSNPCSKQDYKSEML